MSDNKGEFSVWQFLNDKTYKRMRNFVSVIDATNCVSDLLYGPGGSGAIRRIIITDGGDCIAFEWELGKGVTFPPVGEIKK